MDTRAIVPSRLASSVIAVPPLARDAAGNVDAVQNQRLVQHIESGDVSILLYGGNANFYHIRPSEYERTLAMLAEIAGPETLVIPSAGPAYGLSLDQAEILKKFAFPTAMLLPHTGLNTPAGVEAGVQRFAEAYGKPVVLYIKQEGYITPDGAARLVQKGVISWIKYAIVRENPEQDPFLEELVKLVDPRLIVSGIGEQPAIIHMRQFGCVGFTAGCVCVGPKLSANMLQAIHAENWDEAERLRKIFLPLEDLRNGINPVRVLHEAVTLSGIADMGDLTPLLSPITAEQKAAVRATASALLAQQGAA